MRCSLAGVQWITIWVLNGIRKTNGPTQQRTLLAQQQTRQIIIQHRTQWLAIAWNGWCLYTLIYRLNFMEKPQPHTPTTHIMT